jgi:hypothetical protein
MEKTKTTHVRGAHSIACCSNFETKNIYFAALDTIVDTHVSSGNFKRHQQLHVTTKDKAGIYSNARRRNLGTFWWCTPALRSPCDRVAWLQTGKRSGVHSRSSARSRTTVHGNSNQNNSSHSNNGEPIGGGLGLGGGDERYSHVRHARACRKSVLIVCQIHYINW